MSDPGAREQAPPPRAELRAALARAHLAASELRREVRTPRGHRLLERIVAATRLLDTEWLAPAAAVEASVSARGRWVDPAEELRRLHRRLAPALRLRGTSWHLAAEGAPGAGRVDADRLRRAVCDGLDNATTSELAPAVVASRLVTHDAGCTVEFVITAAAQEDATPGSLQPGSGALPQRRVVVSLSWEEGSCSAS